MLCPEVWNFPPPKVISSCKTNQNIDSVKKVVTMNDFYKSLIVTCPDEINVPSDIVEVISEDNEYYKLSNCPLTEFIDNTFIENFVKNGNLYCLSTDTNCIVQNSVAITPDGSLTLHILDFIYQTLGLEGTSRPNNYYEITIDLKHLINKQKLYPKVKCALSKLETFNFYIIWEPHTEDICPSSIAKYFHDKDISVSVCTIELRTVSPEVTEIPSLIDVEMDEMVEWIGMVAYEANLHPTEGYVSTYFPPDCTSPLKTGRISVLIAKGFFTPTVISRVCDKLSEYLTTRELVNFWTALSIQSHEECLWRWNYSSPKMFQSHNSSCNIFFTKTGNTVYSIGQLKYS